VTGKGFNAPFLLKWPSTCPKSSRRLVMALCSWTCWWGWSRDCPALADGLRAGRTSAPAVPQPLASPLRPASVWHRDPQTPTSRRPCSKYLRTQSLICVRFLKSFRGGYRAEEPTVNPGRYPGIWLLVLFFLLMASFFPGIPHFLCIQITAG